MRRLILLVTFCCLAIPASASATKVHLDLKFARNYKADYNQAAPRRDAITKLVCELVSPKGESPYENCLVESKNDGHGLFCAAMIIDPLYDNPKDAIIGGKTYSCTKISAAIYNLQQPTAPPAI